LVIATADSKLGSHPPGVDGRRKPGKIISCCRPAFKRAEVEYSGNNGIAALHNKTGFERGSVWCRLQGSGSNLTSGEPPNMSMHAHLAELERRHQALEAEIAEARAHPSTDDLEIVELKRRKLLVKDEIARLSVDALVH
jgi:hypothetical protein